MKEGGGEGERREGELDEEKGGREGRGEGAQYVNVIFVARVWLCMESNHSTDVYVII